MGPGDSDDHRLAAAPAGRVRPESRHARPQDPHPQLRPWRRGHVAVMGHGQHGRGPGRAASRPPRRGHRLRCRRPHVGARAAASRFRGHHLRRRRATRPDSDVELVAGRIHAHFWPVDSDRSDAGMDRAVPAGRRDRLPPAPAPRRTAIWHQLDHQLLTHRRRADGVGHEHAAASTHAERSCAARARRAPLPHALCDRATRHAHRTVDLRRSVTPRFQGVRRCDRGARSSRGRPNSPA